MDNLFKEHRFLGKINLAKGTPPSQFILYNHVTDLYYYGREKKRFLSMRETLISYLKSLDYKIIAIFNLIEGLVFADKEMIELYVSILTPTVQNDYDDERQNSKNKNQQSHSSAQGINIENELRGLTRLLEQTGQKAAVIIERVQNFFGESPASEEHSLVDYLQSWPQICGASTNKNVSFLIGDCKEINNLPPYLVGNHRSGVEIINVGLPNQKEITECFKSAEDKNFKIDNNQKFDLINRLIGCDCTAILNYFLECKHSTKVLNMRNLREIMTKTPDIWQEILTEENIKKIGESLHDRIIGQEYAIDRLIATLRSVRFKLEDQINSGKFDEKPLACFFMAGPTGVGKTEIFRTLSEIFTKIRAKKINMPEYKQEHDAYRFLGAPPGYTGHGKGELGQFLYENPAAIVLFDEFEKAHKKIWENFLTMLEGGLTAGDGTKIDLSQTILFITSNAGSDKLIPINSNITGGEKENILNQNIKIVQEALQRQGAAPELIGRLLDTIIPFNNLTPEVAEKIIRLSLQKLHNKIMTVMPDKNKSINFDNSINLFLLSEKYETYKHLGARTLVEYINGTLQQKILKLLENVKQNE